MNNKWGSINIGNNNINSQNIAGLGFTALGSVGQGISNLQRQYEIDNAGNPVLANTVSGNTWGDVLNGNDLNQGLANIRAGETDFSNVLNNANLYNAYDANDMQRSVNYNQTGPWGAMLQDASTLGSAGMMFGPVGAAIGAGVGALSGFTRSFVSDLQHKRNANLENQQIARSNDRTLNSLQNTALANNKRDLRNYKIMQEGGYFDGFNGITKINNGGTHQQNPYGGITVGYASDGLPNKVEEGEIIYNDYVYSNRLKTSKTLLNEYNLPVKYAGKSFAEVADKLQKESENRPNDSVSKQTLDDNMGRLRDAQEDYKAKLEERRLARAFDKLPTETKAQLTTNMMNQFALPPQQYPNSMPISQPEIPQETPAIQEPSLEMEQQTMSKGGKIHIKPSKRGTFTAAATKHGMGVQAFANQVLSHPENYSPAMRKKANFARNAAHWGQYGIDLTEPDDSPIMYGNGNFALPVEPTPTVPTVPEVTTPTEMSIQDQPTWSPNITTPAPYFNQPLSVNTDASAMQTPDINMFDRNTLAEIEYGKQLAQPTAEPEPTHILNRNFNYDNGTFFVNKDMLQGSDKYGNKANFTNLFTDAKRHENLDNLFSSENMSDEQFNQIMDLYKNTRQDDWTHTPKNREQAINWLTDSHKGDEFIQDWHNFVNSLYWKQNPQEATTPTRHWLWKTDENGQTYKTPINEEEAKQYSYLNDLDEEGADESGIYGYDKYYEPKASAPIENIKQDQSNPQLPTDAPDWMRYAPVLGGLGAMFNRPDYTYANQLRGIAGKLNPISAPSLGGYRKYNPYDINLANNEAMAQQAAANRANSASGNRATQGANAVALQNAYAKENAARNLQWQQSNEANRLATDTFNLGIDQTKLNTIQAYDQMNQQAKNAKLNMLAQAAQAQDASDTAWATAQSNNITNMLNNLGNIGKENWARNERNALLNIIGPEEYMKYLTTKK